MTAIHTGEFDLDHDDGLIYITQGDQEELREQLRIDPRCFKMGPFAVVVRAADFVFRAKTAIEKLGYAYNSTLVKYFDPAIQHGTFTLSEMPFWKRNIFAYQNEFRICVDTHTDDTEDRVVWIDIGGLTDIAAKMSAENVNSAYTVEFEKD